MKVHRGAIAAVLVAGALIASSGGAAAQDVEPVVEEQTAEPVVEEEPVTPPDWADQEPGWDRELDPPIDVPADVVMKTPEQLLKEQVAGIDLAGWNQVRQELGMVPLTKVSDLVLSEVLQNNNTFAVPILDSERDKFIEWRRQADALREYYDENYEALDDVDHWMDEISGTLTIWTSNASLVPKGPVGLELVDSKFSRSQIESFLASDGFDQALRTTGADIVGDRISQAGLELTVVASKKSPDQLIEIDEALTRLLAETGSREFAIDLVVLSEPVPDTDTHCDNRWRCNVPRGGQSWGNASLGFVMGNSTYTQRGVSTAGHSSSTAQFAVRGTDSANNGTGLSIASVWPSNLRIDVALFDAKIGTLPAANAGGLAPVYYRDDSYANQPITSVRVNILNGDQLCLSAKNETYRRCGTVIDNDYDNLPTSENALRVEPGPGLHPGGWRSGDSGGAITYRFHPDWAAGIQSAIRDDEGNGAIADIDMIAYHAYRAPWYLQGWAVSTASSEARGRIQSFIASTYQAAAQRRPSLGEANYWAGVVSTGSCGIKSRDFLWLILANETAAQRPINTNNNGTNASNKVKRVRRLYWAVFNRKADQGGLNYWSSIINNESDWQWLVSHFLNHAEASWALNGVVGKEEGPC